VERRTCIVTGGTSGVGMAIARGLARAGHEVIIAARDVERGQAVERALQSETGNRMVTYRPLDLAEPRSVRAFVADFLRDHAALHVLSNNAADLSLTRRETAYRYGVDSIFAVGYLGHFLLTQLLLNALREGAPSRVVTVAGKAGLISRVRPDFESAGRTERYSLLAATLRTALAKTLFTFELARRVGDSGVTANVFHPGMVRSSLAHSLPWYLRAPARLAVAVASAECSTGVFLCLDPSIVSVSGRFFERRRVVTFHPRYDTMDAARRLWETSETLVGER